MYYTIKEITEKYAIPSSTLRYYEKEGLLPNLQRSTSQNRIFSQRDIMILLVVCCLKKTGMSIKEIRIFIELYMQGDETILARKTMFENHKQQIQLQIDELHDNLATLERKMKMFLEPINMQNTDV